MELKLAPNKHYLSQSEGGLLAKLAVRFPCKVSAERSAHQSPFVILSSLLAARFAARIFLSRLLLRV